MTLDELYDKGCGELDLGKYEQALETFNSILEQNSEYYKALNKIGVLYARQNDLGNAKEYFEMALDINPDYGPSLVNLGNIYKELGDIELAKRYYEESIKVDVDYYLAYYNMACIYKERGDIEEYIKYIKKYKRLYKRHLDTPDYRKMIYNKRFKNVKNIFTALIVTVLVLMFMYLK